MVTEAPEISVPNPEYVEHSKAAKAKRVIAGALPIAIVNGESVAAEASVAPGSALALTTGKAYRIISDGDFYMKLGKTGVSATANDIYVPAGTEVMVRMSDGMNAIDTAAGPTPGTFVQAIEVQ